jgi:hypothetical protein
MSFKACHPLWIIHDVDRIDKQRELVIALFTVGARIDGEVVGERSGGSTRIRTETEDRPTDPGALSAGRPAYYPNAPGSVPFSHVSQVMQSTLSLSSSNLSVPEISDLTRFSSHSDTLGI